MYLRKRRIGTSINYIFFFFFLFFWKKKKNRELHFFSRRSTYILCTQIRLYTPNWSSSPCSGKRRYIINTTKSQTEHLLELIIASSVKISRTCSFYHSIKFFRTYSPPVAPSQHRYILKIFLQLIHCSILLIFSASKRLCLPPKITKIHILKNISRTCSLFYSKLFKT